ncbi:MAG: glycosyltransferase family 4 protein [Actinomycetota bacterium]
MERLSGSPNYRVLVHADPLLPPRTGIAHYSIELLRAFRDCAGAQAAISLIGFRFALKPFSPPAGQVRLANEMGWGFDIHPRVAPGYLYQVLRRRDMQFPVPIDIFKSRNGTAVYFFPNFVGLPVLRSPSVIAVHDLAFKLLPETLPRSGYASFLEKYLPRYINRASRVVVNSQSTRQALIEHYGARPDKVVVLYPGVDHSAFNPDVDGDLRRRVRERYGLTGPYILALGTLEPRKNLIRAIEAFARLETDSQIPLVIAGAKGWKNDEVFAKTRELGVEERVRFLGYVDEDERPPLLAEARLLVLPSLLEGFGIPVVEAMACGTPVVTSKAGGLPEAGGDAALYVDPTDVLGIRDGIAKALNDETLRRRMVATGLEHSRKFTWTRSGAKLAKLFGEVARESAPAERDRRRQSSSRNSSEFATSRKEERHG